MLKSTPFGVGYEYMYGTHPPHVSSYNYLVKHISISIHCLKKRGILMLKSTPVLSSL